MVRSFGSGPRPTVKFQPHRGPQVPAALAALRGVFTFSWRGAGALGPRRGPRRLNNKRGAAKRQEDRTMSKGPGPGGSAASSAPPAATAQVLQAQPEKPQHYTYVERGPPPPPPRRARTRLTSAASVSHARRESARRPLPSPPPHPPPPLFFFSSLRPGSDRFQPAWAGPNCLSPLATELCGRAARGAEETGSPPPGGEGGSSACGGGHTSEARPSRPNCSSDSPNRSARPWRGRPSKDTEQEAILRGRAPRMTISTPARRCGVSLRPVCPPPPPHGHS